MNWMANLVIIPPVFYINLIIIDLLITIQAIMWQSNCKFLRFNVWCWYITILAVWNWKTLGFTPIVWFPPRFQSWLQSELVAWLNGYSFLSRSERMCIIFSKKYWINRLLCSSTDILTRLFFAVSMVLARYISVEVTIWTLL